MIKYLCVFALMVFSASCEKEDLFNGYMGNASVESDGEVLPYHVYLSDTSGLDSFVSLSFDNYRNEIWKWGLALRKIPVDLNRYDLNSNKLFSDEEVASAFLIQIVDGDATGDRYVVNNLDTIPDWVELSEITSATLVGQFQASFIHQLDTGSNPRVSPPLSLIHI